MRGSQGIIARPKIANPDDRNGPKGLPNAPGFSLRHCRSPEQSIPIESAGISSTSAPQVETLVETNRERIALTTMMEQPMTSAGKLFFGTCILTAAFFTAKYLHQSPVEVSDIPVVQPPVTKLNWQVQTTSEPASNGLREVATARESKGDVRFARLTSAQEAVAPPPPITDRLESSGPTNAAINSRFPIPFAIAATPHPASQLMAVDDEEVDSHSAVREFVSHTVQFGETLPQIAMQYTGRRESYMAIYQANLDVLSSPADVTPGIVLKIPVR